MTARAEAAKAMTTARHDANLATMAEHRGLDGDAARLRNSANEAATRGLGWIAAANRGAAS